MYFERDLKRGYDLCLCLMTKSAMGNSRPNVQQHLSQRLLLMSDKNFNNANYIKMLHWV